MRWHGDSGYMWLGITQHSLFNRLRAEGEQVFLIGWAQVIQRAGNTHYVIDAMAREAGCICVPLPEDE